MSSAQIEESLRLYFDGLYHSDSERLGRVFHPRAIYTSATGGDLVYKTMDEYLPIVQNRPSPASRGEARQDRIVSIDFAGPATAIVRAECVIASRRFEDLLTLIRVDGRWQIIAKAFHYIELGA